MPSAALPPHRQLGLLRHQPTCHPQAPQATRNTQLSLLTGALLWNLKSFNFSFAFNSQVESSLLLAMTKECLPTLDHNIAVVLYDKLNIQVTNLYLSRLKSWKQRDDKSYIFSYQVMQRQPCFLQLDQFNPSQYVLTSS